MEGHSGTLGSAPSGDGVIRWGLKIGWNRGPPRIVFEVTLMSRSGKLGAAGLGIFTCAVIASAPACAATATFTVSPTSGPPGTTITVTSVTKCLLPAGVTGQPFIRVFLGRGRTVVATTDIPVSASGSWAGTLTVGSLAAPGVDTLVAYCIASPQAEGSVLDYGPTSFTVTPAGALANTGVSLWPEGIAGGVLVIAGLCLLLVARRPQTYLAAHRPRSRLPGRQNRR